MENPGCHSPVLLTDWLLEVQQTPCLGLIPKSVWLSRFRHHPGLLGSAQLFCALTEAWFSF